MHALVTTLTTAALLWQGVFGCCWRPAPAAVAARTSYESCASSSCCLSGCTLAEVCDTTPLDNHEQAPALPQPGKTQCQGVCTYVLPQKTLADHVPLEISYDLPSNGRLSIEFQLKPGGCDPAAAVRCEPPLRLHLLNQNLLI